jgi:hypothetical protein
MKTDAIAQFLLELFPQVGGEHGNWHLVGIAAGGTYPAPVAAGLLTSDYAFVAHQYRETALAQRPGGTNADDTGADDNGVNGLGHRV